MCLGLSSPLENVISCAENIRSVPKGQDFSCDKGHWVERARDGEEEGIHSLLEDELGTTSSWRGLLELGEKS